jgi:hypothetical protein
MAPQVRAAAVAAWPHWLPCCASCPPCIRPAYARGPTRGARRAVLRPGVLGQAVRRSHGLLRVVPRLRRAARGAGRAPVAQHPHPAGGALFVLRGTPSPVRSAGTRERCARRQWVRLLHAGWLRAAGGGRRSRRTPLCSAWCTLRCAQVGVGTSALQLDMVLDGYHSITNVDYSAVAIERMREMHKGVCGLHYVLADCRRAPIWGTDLSGTRKPLISVGYRGCAHAAGVQARADSLGSCASAQARQRRAERPARRARERRERRAGTCAG